MFGLFRKKGAASPQPHARGWRVATGFVGPEPAFIGVVGDAVWIGSQRDAGESRQLRSFDCSRGSPGAQLELPSPLDGWELVDGPRLVQQPSRGVVSVFDIEAGRQTFSAKVEGKLVGAHGGRVLVLREDGGLHELVVLDARSGSTLHAVKLGLGVVPRDERVLANKEHALLLATDACLGVNLATGRVVFKKRLDAHARAEGPFDDQIFVRDSDSLACVDLLEGRISWETPLDASMVGDQLCAVRVGSQRLHVIGSVERRGGSSILITPIERATGSRGDTVDRKGVRSLPLEAMLSPPPLPHAVLASGQLELWRDGERPVRLPLPAGRLRKTHCTATQLFVLGQELLGIELSSIPKTSEAGLSLATVASATGADAPAEVTFVGASAVIMIRHPLYGDTRVSRTPTSPAVKVGDRLLLEGITSLPGGVVQVGSWRLAGAESGKPVDLELGVEALPARPAEMFRIRDESALFGEAEEEAPPPVRPPLAPLVEPIERLFGGAPIPVLRKLAQACDASPATRARWDGVGPALSLEPYEPEVEVPGLEALAFRPFATEDERVFHGVVRDPRGTSRGIAVLNAEGDHDFFWSAGTFEAWLARVLADAFPPSRARLLLEDLGLPESFLEEAGASAPAWFSAQLEE